MTIKEKLDFIKKTVGDFDNSLDEMIISYLDIAGVTICRKVYPFDLTKNEVPEKYALKQCEVAIFLMNKQGAEGETYHAENGVIRTYGDPNVPASMLKEVIPFAGGIK